MKQLLLSCMLLFTFNSSFSQDYALWQKQFGYLFADLPLDRNSDVWLENIHMNQYRFKDSNICNCPTLRKEFVVNEINEYRQNISGVEKAYLMIQAQTAFLRDGNIIVDTIMTITSLIYLKTGISKDEFLSIFKALTKQIRIALPFSSSSKFNKTSNGSSKYNYEFSERQFESLYPLSITYWYNEHQNNYVIQLHFSKYRNGAAEIWPR